MPRTQMLEARLESHNLSILPVICQKHKIFDFYPSAFNVMVNLLGIKQKTAMTTITSIHQLDFDKEYTYADYLTWRIKEKIELIKGKILAMSPAPLRRHQDIAQNMNQILFRHFYKKPCKVYFAPFDVRLYSPSKEITTVVQPDLCVVCDLSKLDDKGCLGSPDLVVEIVSPGNSKKEMGIKFDLYQEVGVREYWIVNPLEETLLIYVLKDGKYVGERPYARGEIATASSVIFPELIFDLEAVFLE